MARPEAAVLSASLGIVRNGTVEAFSPPR